MTITFKEYLENAEREIRAAAGSRNSSMAREFAQNQLREQGMTFPAQEQSRGMKYDGGKPLAAIPLKDFNLALLAVAEIGTFGANKYARSSWKTVPDAAVRYEDAMVRHQLMKETEDNDPESGLLHLAHFAWNALAILQLKLEETGKNSN